MLKTNNTKVRYKTDVDATTALPLLTKALGIKTQEELNALAEQSSILPIPLLLRLRYLLFGAPAPTITSPNPGDIVGAGRTLTVKFTPDPPDLSHELLLIAKSNPAALPDPIIVSILASASTPLPATASADIRIPPDPMPGVQTEYYLELGVQPDLVDEQQRHRIVIKTASSLTVTLDADRPVNTAATPYPVGTTLMFTIGISDGLPPYNYLMLFGDSGTLPVATPVTRLPVMVPPHPYPAGSFTAFAIVTDSLGNAQTQSSGPYFFA